MRAISHRVGCGWFWIWALVGAGGALGAISLGPLLTIPALAAALVIGARRGGRGLFGVASGIGAVLLAVAYLQRQGPGTTCWHTATASGCDQHLNPLPWLVAGLVFFTAGLVGHAWRSAGSDRG